MNPATNHRQEALGAALSTLEKQYGKGTVMRLGDRQDTVVNTVPTGCPPLDDALGVGGLPRGRVVEIFGPEASGKTTLTLHLIAEIQRSGGTAAFVDAEHALDVTYAKALGVDIDALLVAQPDSGEQALEIVETLVRSGAVDLVVVDSVAALVPKAELEGNMGDQHMGLQARLMSQALRKITAITHKTDSLVVFINQVRQKIGVTFGNGEVTTGGNALKFYSSVRIEVRRIGSVTEKQEVIGAKTKLKVVKNKLAPPFRTVETEILFGRGFSTEGDLIDRAEEAGVLGKKGAWFTFGDETIAQGREKLRQRIQEDSAFRATLTAAVAAAGPSTSRTRVEVETIAEAK
jgi:recombination protein RecA